MNLAGVERAREGRRGISWTEKGREEYGSIGMLGWRQVTPRWSYDPVWRQDGRWRMGCWVRRGLPPL